jgi:predicted regulator of Ras-like GTPase activity (Roadblock/LC7/MglB family)
MKTIGKLLLDVQAVENIIKSGETKKIGSGMSTAKIISAARGEGIKNILTTIDTYPGVAGSLIVGHDGLVIASTVQGWDKDMLGALSTALLSTSNLATKKLEIGKLRQMVMLTSWQDGNGGSEKIKTTILTDVDVGILAVFLEDLDLTKLDGLLDTIHTTIHGG